MINKKGRNILRAFFIFFLLAEMAIGLFVSVSEAANKKGPYRETRFVEKKPIKECRRVNARFGYYANPWCTQKEQSIWDRWDTKRFNR